MADQQTELKAQLERVLERDDLWISPSLREPLLSAIWPLIESSLREVTQQRDDARIRMKLDCDAANEYVKRAGEELQRLRAMLAEREWQPMETAKRDRTRHVMLWCADEAPYDWAWRVGVWNDEDADAPYWEYTDETAVYSRAHPPTHWQPLPAPPSSAPAQEPRE